ncbi:MAG: CHAT domain-containing protein [Akkermansiaceae bacterium]|nr:CHAT domain-containing protein [Akkermansiaceae bacterium]
MALGIAICGVAIGLLVSCKPTAGEQEGDGESASKVQELPVDLNALRLAEEEAWWRWQETRAQLAWGEQEAGNFSIAGQLYQEVIESLPEETAQDAPEFLAALEDGWGRACQAMGELDAAEVHLKNGLALREQVENGGELVAQSQGHLGMLALVRGDYEGARQRLNQALESAGNGARETRVFCLGLMGRYELTVRNYGSALRAYDEAIRLAKEIYSKGPELEDLEFNRLVVILRLRGSKAALEEMRDLDFDENVGGTRLAARLNLRAELLQESGNTDDAEADLREAIAILKENYGEEDEALAVYWANLGALLSDAKKYTEAEQCFRKVEAVSGASGEWHQTRVEALWGRIFCLTNEGRLSEARLLLKEGMDRVTELMKRVTSSPDEGARLNFRARIDPFSVLVAMKEWDWLARLLIRNKATLLQGNEGVGPSWKTIRDRLKSDEIFVDTLRFRDSEGTWTYGALVYLAGAETPKWIALADEKRLGRLVLLQKALGDLARKKTGMNVEPLLRDLYQDFWKPLTTALPDGSRRVILCPDGGLGLIPWAALRSEDGRFLCEELESFSLVANARGTLAKSEPLGEAQKVCFGLSDFSDHRAKGAGQWWGEVSDLPGVQAELTKIGGNIYQNDEAKEARLKSLREVPEVLHLATHGIFEGRAGQAGEGVDLEEEWQRGAILLKPGEGDDGVLRIFEIEKLSLEGCRLVTVSSCQSGLGAMVSGEGVVGVNRGFLKAGASRVMVTLWEIRDSTTPDFMAGFYDRAKDVAPEEALWQEQRERLGSSEAVNEAALRYGGFSMMR